MLDNKIEPKITILDCILMLHSAWGNITTKTITNCFAHGLGKSNAEDFSSEPQWIPQLDQLRISVEEYLEYETFDNEVATAEIPTDHDIVSQSESNRASIVAEELDEEESEEEDPVSGRTLYSSYDVLESLHAIKMWISSQSSSDQSVWNGVLAVEKFATTSIINSMRQSKVTEYFKLNEDKQTS